MWDIPPPYIGNLGKPQQSPQNPVPKLPPDGASRVMGEHMKRIAHMEAATLVARQLNVVCAICYLGAYFWFVVASVSLGALLAGSAGTIIVSIIQSGFLILCAKAVAVHAQKILGEALKKVESLPETPITSEMKT